MEVMNAKKRKRQAIFSLLVIFLLGAVTVDFLGWHVDPEKAFYKMEDQYGIGPSEKILFQQYFPERKELILVGRLKRSGSNGYLQIGRLEKTLGFLWKEGGVYPQYFHMDVFADYYNEYKLMLGSVQDPEIKEVYMRYGHWREGKNRTWEIHDIGKGMYQIDADGFFYQDIDVSKALRDDRGNTEYIQTTYIEGRDKDGNILFRHGVDDEGRRFVNGVEVIYDTYENGNRYIVNNDEVEQAMKY